MFLRKKILPVDTRRRLTLITRRIDDETLSFCSGGNL